MTRGQSIVSQLVIVALSGLLLAEDVEHEPVMIEPPPPRPPAPPPAPPPAEEPAAISEDGPAIPPGPRHRFVLPGPLRLDLEPRLGLDRPPPAAAASGEESEAERVARRLRAGIRRLEARDRLRRAHALWGELTERIDACWRPGFAQVDGDERLVGPGAPWLAAETWRRMRQAPPTGGDVWDQQDYLEQGPPLRPLQPTAGPPVDRQGRPAVAAPDYGRVVTLIEVRFGAAGEDRAAGSDAAAPATATAHILLPSGHPRYDAAALDGVRLALERLGASAAPVGQPRAVYALSTEFRLQSHIPIAGLGLELLFTALAPKRVVHARTDLIALPDQPQLRSKSSD